jgi:hypothetical protein
MVTFVERFKPIDNNLGSLGGLRGQSLSLATVVGAA